jgi:predicted nucleotidyltransferase
MDEQLHLTPYANVNAVLHDFLVSIQAILGSHLRGMYLFGSLALGDFDPHGSDIDFVVVTDADIADDLFRALHDMHARFDASLSPWAAKVEAVYIPQDALRRATQTPGQYPQVEKGRTLFLDQLESGWVVQCDILREHGVVVAGPDPRTLIDPVDPDDMRRSAAVIAGSWLERARHDPSWLAWLQHEGGQAFVVLTLCRLLYTLDSGTVASKPAAARWVQKALGKRWAALIERSLAEQHDSRETPDSEVNDTVALIQYTVERCQQQGFPPPPAEPR